MNLVISRYKRLSRRGRKVPVGFTLTETDTVRNDSEFDNHVFLILAPPGKIGADGERHAFVGSTAGDVDDEG